MKKIIITSILGISATLATLALAETPMDSDSSHAGAFVADSVITTKVKAKLAEKHLSTLANIRVDTDNAGVVWLSGKAPTSDARDLAGMIAKDTDGVISVHNHIVVGE
jgi:hyperosmotically inducible protein